MDEIDSNCIIAIKGTTKTIQFLDPTPPCPFRERHREDFPVNAHGKERNVQGLRIRHAVRFSTIGPCPC